jgi:hypothetical protein
MSDEPTSIAEPLIEDLGPARTLTQGIDQPDALEELVIPNARD